MLAWQRADLISDVLALGAACKSLKHGLQATHKAPIIWAEGLLHVCLLFYFSDKNANKAPDSFGHRVGEKLRSLDVTPDTYLWPRVLQPHAVYVKLQVSWRHFKSIARYRQPNTMMYIGSTSVSEKQSGMQSKVGASQNAKESKCTGRAGSSVLASGTEL